jgi:hypothetical protein
LRNRHLQMRSRNKRRLSRPTPRLKPLIVPFTLHVFGGRTIKILFDARTQLYRDGIKVAPGDLYPNEHAAVETVLDGTNVFAVSIHTLSRSPEGECQGQLLNYDPATRELTVNDRLSREPLKLLVPTGTPVLRQGQAASSAQAGRSDLVTGALISIRFQPDNDGHDVANEIRILATPGSAFQFTGNISSLDRPSGLLVLVDPRDDKSYEVSFDPTVFPISEHLHLGEQVTVTVHFDGARYTASAITLVKSL